MAENRSRPTPTASSPKTRRNVGRILNHPLTWILATVMLGIGLDLRAMNHPFEPRADPKLFQYAHAYAVAVWISRDAARTLPGWPADLCFIMPLGMTLAYLITAPRWLALVIAIGVLLLLALPALALHF